MRAGSGGTDSIAELGGIGSLRGLHNAQNAACAAAAALALGLDPAAIQAGLRSFPGLAHRMEEVGRRGAVLFVNDSKATNADSAAQALACFSDIFWIAGGKPKTGGIESLREFFPRIRKAYLIGEAADEFAATLGGDVPHEIAGTLDKAVAGGRARCRKPRRPREPVVLLSPACASFDQYRNFEVRGDAFRDLVRALPGLTANRNRSYESRLLISWKPSRCHHYCGTSGPGERMASRAQPTPFSEWWWTVDRLTLAALGALMLGGIVLCLAASPPVAARIGLDPFHFVNRQVLFLIPAAAVLIATSFLSPREIRQVALIVFVVSLVLIARDALFRRRDQRRAALAGDPRRQHPAVGISQAGFRHPDRLAVRRNGEAARNAGQHRRAGAARRRGRAAGAAARFRPDHADLAGLGRAVLYGRHALHLGDRARRARPASA